MRFFIIVIAMSLSTLASGSRAIALQTLPGRGCNQWPQHLSGLPRTVSMASIVWKVVGGDLLEGFLPRLNA